MENTVRNLTDIKVRSWGKRTIWAELWRIKWLYVFLLPAVLFSIIFLYRPMYGVLIAFQEYGIMEVIENGGGVIGTKWIGFDNFKMFLGKDEFWTSLRNTVLINMMQILICFPAPIILAILITEIRSNTTRRITQSITYLPHFVSWVIVAGLVYRILDIDTGVLNAMRTSLGFEKIPFMREPKYFLAVFTSSSLWKGIGWNSIVYCSSITAISPSLYEAATIDGANRFRRIWHITLPSIMPIIVLLFILTISNFFRGSFEAIYVMRNAMVTSTSDTIEIFAYFKGIAYAEYGYATAIGLAQSLVSLTLLLTANVVMKKITDHSLF